MSDDDSLRPRRAMPPEREPVDPVPGDDDTSADDTFSGRRGTLDLSETDAGEVPAESDESAQQMQAAGGTTASTENLQTSAQDTETRTEDTEIDENTLAPDTQPDPEQGTGEQNQPVIPAEHAAFMRPGTVPADVLAQTDSTSAVLDAGSSVVAPAASVSLSEAAVEAMPVDPAALPATDRSPSSLTSASDSRSASSADPSSPSSPEDAISAGSTRRRPAGLSRPVKIAAALLVPALMVGAFFGVRALTRKGEVVVQHTPSASSATPTPTPTPALSAASLATTAELGTALGNTWTEAQTWDTVTAADPGITCMSNLPELPAPNLTAQRGLTSNAPSKTAALQRMDSFASAEVAHQAYMQRMAALAACNDVPALITSAAAITGVSDESFSMTVAFEDADLLYHTVVISRTGQTVTMTDVANVGEPVGADKAALALQGSISRLCTTSKGTCPTTPTAKTIAIPSTPIAGWLAQSDLPRITRGQGMWSPTAPVNVSTKGSQCEDMTLATATGPTARNQRSYILTQDDAAPEGFGVDQVLFTFADEAAAKAFADKLIANINDCAKRTTTAKLPWQSNVSITGDGGMPVAGRVWKVTQAISADNTVLYRVGVLRAGNKVAYVVSNTTDTFDFSDRAWLLVAARAGQRATQVK